MKNVLKTLLSLYLHLNMQLYRPHNSVNSSIILTKTNVCFNIYFLKYWLYSKMCGCFRHWKSPTLMMVHPTKDLFLDIDSTYPFRPVLFPLRWASPLPLQRSWHYSWVDSEVTCVAALTCGSGWVLAAERDPVLELATLRRFRRRPATMVWSWLLRGAATLLRAAVTVEAAMGSPLEGKMALSQWGWWVCWRSQNLLMT